MDLEEPAARRYADLAIAQATELGVRVGVAIVDQDGVPLQMDRMDGAPPSAADLAEAKAQTALHFQRPSGAIPQEFIEQVQRISQIPTLKLLAVPGGLPLLNGDQVVGALGVSGTDAVLDDRIAQSVAAAGARD